MGYNILRIKRNPPRNFNNLTGMKHFLLICLLMLPSSYSYGAEPSNTNHEQATGEKNLYHEQATGEKNLYHELNKSKIKKDFIKHMNDRFQEEGIISIVASNAKDLNKNIKETMDTIELSEKLLQMLYSGAGALLLFGIVRIILIRRKNKKNTDTQAIKIVAFGILIVSMGVLQVRLYISDEIDQYILLSEIQTRAEDFNTTLLLAEKNLSFMKDSKIPDFYKKTGIDTLDFEKITSNKNPFDIDAFMSKMWGGFEVMLDKHTGMYYIPKSKKSSQCPEKKVFKFDCIEGKDAFYSKENKHLKKIYEEQEYFRAWLNYFHAAEEYKDSKS